MNDLISQTCEDPDPNLKSNLNLNTGTSTDLFDKSKEIASSAELQDKPDIVPGLVPVIELEHVGAAESVYYLFRFREVKII